MLEISKSNINQLQFIENSEDRRIRNYDNIIWEISWFHQINYKRKIWERGGSYILKEPKKKSVIAMCRLWHWFK